MLPIPLYQTSRHFTEKGITPHNRKVSITIVNIISQKKRKKILTPQKFLSHHHGFTDA